MGAARDSFCEIWPRFGSRFGSCLVKGKRYFTIVWALNMDQIRLLMDDYFGDCRAGFLAGQQPKILFVRFGSTR